MQDMVPPEEDSKSIRNIKINKDNGNSNSSEAQKEGNKANYISKRENKYRRRNKSHKGWIIGIAAVILIFVFIALTPILSNADIKITPRMQEVEISGTFNISGDESDDADLFYQTAEYEAISEKAVEATGEENVENKASGRIRVYNNFSNEAETLIANTRFESEDGLVYRVQDAFTVPGINSTNGESVPGSIEVTVYADEAGKEYNVESSDFTIPGLKGDERYDKMYAETVTAIDGGFSGVKKVASEEDINAALESIEESAREDAQEKTRSEIPDEFIEIPNSMEVSFERISDAESNNENQLVVRGRAIATVALIKKTDLASFIAKETIGTYDDDEVRLDDYESIEISPASELEFSIKELPLFEISIDGESMVIWEIDYTKLEEDLLGVSEDEAQEVLSSYDSINEARISISPFWKGSIPDESEKVQISEEIK